MKLPLVRSSIVTSSLLLTASAWPLVPLFHQEQQKRAPASYSVVAVDGGSTTDSAPTATVTNLVTRTQTRVTTQLATTVLTESEAPTTIVLTNFVTSATTIIETPPSIVSAAVMTQTPPAAASNPSSQPAPSSTISPHTFVTVTVTDSSAPTTVPYDNGLWHTTYYYTVSSEKSTIPPMPSPTIVNDGQWRPPNGWNATWGGKQ